MDDEITLKLRNGRISGVIAALRKARAKYGDLHVLAYEEASTFGDATHLTVNRADRWVELASIPAEDEED